MNTLIKRNKQEIIVCLVFIFFALAFNIYRVESDGYKYYSFLEYTLRLPDPECFPGGYSGLQPYQIEFHQSGCVYFNIPFYLIAYAIEKMLPVHLNFNGITLRQASINLASNFYIILSLLLVIKLLKRLKFKYIILPALSILFSTSAFTIGVVQPSFNHAVDIFVVTLFVYLIITSEQKSDFRRVFWLGILYPVLILVRYFNFVFLLPLVIYYLHSKEWKKIKYLFIGLLSVIWAVPFILYIYNGGITSLRTNNNIMQIVETIPLVPRYFFKYLLHPLHGLFIWSPVTIFSGIGLLLFPKPKHKIGYLFLGAWFLFLFMSGFFSAWYGGWSFSNRYLTGLFPVYILGLSAFLEKYGKKMAVLISILTAYSVLLYLNWRLNIMNGEFGTPWNMVESWLKKEADASYDKKLSLKIFFNRLYETCRYKYLFYILK